MARFQIYSFHFCSRASSRESQHGLRMAGEPEKAVKYTYDQANDKWSRERVLVRVDDTPYAEGSKVIRIKCRPDCICET